MNASIRTPRTLDAGVIWLQSAQGGFDTALDRGEVYLALPADKGFAVVFNFKRVSGHLDAIARVHVFAKSMKVLFA